MPTSDVTSSAAPVADRLRTTQSIAPPPNVIDPAFSTRRRGTRRVSSIRLVVSQELRRMRRLARSRTFGRIAAEFGLQLHQIDEYIGLAAQFVGDHRWLARNRRDHGNPDAAALHRFDQRAEIAVAGKQYDLIDMLGELHRIDREFDIHVALDLAAAAGVDEF